MQLPENEMSCEPTKEHVQLPSQESITNPSKKLLQKPLQDPCQIHMEELPNEVWQEPLSCVEQVATHNVSLQTLHKSLQQPSELLSNIKHYQESMQEMEVQFYLWCLYWKQNAILVLTRELHIARGMKVNLMESVSSQ